MIRILIVDDEILVRLSLKTLIPWHEHGFEVIGEAENGVEALAMLERSHCDIVLTDIRMPEMDGIALMSTITRQWPHIRCLILSNYNDFDYVQKALQLGAVDYMLKLAWVPEELLEKCQRIGEEIENSRIQQSEKDQLVSKVVQLKSGAKRGQLQDLFMKHSSKLETDALREALDLQCGEPPYRIVCISIDEYRRVNEENRFKSEQLLSYTVGNILEEIMKKNGGGELVETLKGKFALILTSFSEITLEEMRSASATYARVSLSFGISQNCTIYELHRAYAAAEESLDRKFHDPDKIMFYSERMNVTAARYRPEIQEVIDIIHKEFNHSIKVSELAKRIGFVENYLSVLFKKETGDKIVDYITKVRMKRARELLADPTYKIYEISEMVGYGDSNHFSKYFKKTEGVFPLEYRKMVLGK